MTSEPEQPDVDGLVEQLQARVEERRRSGAYPPDLEQRMAEHFERITHARVVPDMEGVRAALAELSRRFDFALDRTPVESRLPGGSQLHKAMAKLQERQLSGAYEQVRFFAEGVFAALTAIADAMEQAESHVHRDLVGQIDGMLERVAQYERAPAGSAESVADLRARVEALEALERRRGFRPWFDSSRWEALASGGGVDMASLAAAADESVESLSVGRVERLTAQEVADLVLVLSDKVRPGGQVVVSGVHPESAGALAALSLDPTSLGPVHPAYLSFLFGEAGFRSVGVERGADGEYVLTAVR